ncbi:uncharacterized protein [Typha angustifolia]|uniref:uncharacterized protein n=1 Tax=Typha angustifolia TaxID=59011 RepID=UPI003C2BD0E5
MDRVVILNDDQLCKLALIIYRTEEDAIYSIKFGSENERANYLADSRSNYEAVLGLLDAGSEVKRKYQNDKVKAPIANNINSYIVYCVNNALQTVPNYLVRMKYLEKINEHIQSLIKDLDEVRPTAWNNDDVERLGIEAAKCGDAMLKFTKMYKSSLSHDYSTWVKSTGMEFHELVESYQVELGLKGAFEELEDVQKLKVYDRILQVSGLGSIEVDDVKTVIRGVGKLVLLYKAGTLVWDVFSVEHGFQIATRDAVVDVASYVGGALVGRVVTAALTSGALEGIEASAMFVLLAGTMSSIIGSFLIGAFVGLLLDFFINSGGKDTFSTDGHVCYVAPMPDGVSLARQIAYEDNPPKP